MRSTRFSVGDGAFMGAIAFLLGALSANLGWGIDFLGLVFCASILAVVVFRKSIRRREIVCLFAFLLFGIFYFHLYVRGQSAQTDVPFGTNISFRAVVTDEPKFSEKFILLAVTVESPYSGNLTVFAPTGDEFQYGDEIDITGTVNAPRFVGDGLATFPKTIRVIGSKGGAWWYASLLGFKATIQSRFSEVLPAPEAGLLGGITLGGTEGVDADMKNDMSLSGTSYILTMYGYKINVIVFIVAGMFGGLVTRRLRSCLAIALIILFVIMAAGAISAVRAGIMACTILVAREMGRIVSMRNVIACTAVVFVLWEPTILVQPAFLLSFLSLLGILYLGPALMRALHWDRIDTSGDFLGLRNAVVVSSSSLIAIVPIVIVAFGRFSPIAFISNILIFPTIPATMFLGCMVAVASLFSVYGALVTAKFAEALLWYQLTVIRWSAALSVPLPITFNAAWSFMLYYGCLAWFIYRYSARPAIPVSVGNVSLNYD